MADNKQKLDPTTPEGANGGVANNSQDATNKSVKTSTKTSKKK